MIRRPIMTNGERKAIEKKVKLRSHFATDICDTLLLTRHAIFVTSLTCDPSFSSVVKCEHLDSEHRDDVKIKWSKAESSFKTGSEKISREKEEGKEGKWGREVERGNKLARGEKRGGSTCLQRGPLLGGAESQVLLYALTHWCWDII